MLRPQTSRPRAHRAPAPSSARRTRLTLTNLEDRAVPSTVIENEIDGTAWNNAIHSPSVQTIPAASFTAPHPPGHVSVSAPTATIEGKGGGSDIDFYRINTTGPVQLVLDVDNTPYTFDTMVTVFSPGGSVLGFNDDGGNDPGSSSGLDAFLSTSLPAAGTYFIAVNRYSGFPATPPSPFANTGFQPYTNSSYRLHVSQVAANQPPTANPDSYTVNEDGALNVGGSGVLGNDSDPNGNPLTVVGLAAWPTNGQVTSLSPSGAFQYVPNANFFGTDTFRYIVADSQGATSQATVTINVVPVNDAPIAVPDTAETDEDKSVNIAILANDLPGPANENAQGLFVTAINGTPVSAGSVVPTSHGSVKLLGGGIVKYTPAADYNGPDSFTYTVTDTGAPPASAITTGSVTINPVNDGPTDIALSNASIAENSPPGTAIGLLSTADVDLGDSHVYTLPAGVLDNNKFVISGNTLKAAGPFDFETKSSYKVRVVATDSGGESTFKVFTIAVTNVNEAPTDVALDNASIPENSAAGTVVGSLSATDPDAGDTHAFTLVSGAGDADNGLFEIAGNALKAKQPFDFEAKASYSVRVRATDAGGQPYEEVLTISITNVNEAPTDIALDNASVPENSPNGTTVGKLTTTDPDTGDTFAYTLLNDAGGRFALAGNQIVVANSGLLDFEMNPTHTVRVKVTDAGGLSFEKDFVINLTNVFESITLTFTPQQLDAFSPNTISTLQAYLAAPTGPNAVALNALGLKNYLNATVVVPGADEAHIQVFTDATAYDITTAFLLLDENDGVDHIILDPKGDKANLALKGTPKTDIIFGFGGNDVITGLDGKDAVFGGTGNDKFLATGSEAEFDTMYGGAGADTLKECRSPLHPTAGIVLDGFGPANGIEAVKALAVLGNAGANVLDFTAVKAMDVPAVYGLGGGDTIKASSGTVAAGLAYHGGDGSDVLIGGSLADRLFGDAGNDTITGKGGSDVYQFSPESPTDADTITDFVKGKDKVKLHDFRVELVVPDRGRTERWLKFSDLVLTVSGGNTLVTLPDGKTIKLLGVTGLKAADFIITPVGH
jgi:hypothetical protein